MCDELFAFRRQNVRQPATSHLHQPRSIAITIHFFVLGLFFIILAAILVALELARESPIRIGYWNGAITAFSALTMFCVSAYANVWTLVILLFTNAFTILGCIVVVLASAHEDRIQQPSYWVCLAVLTLSIYSIMFLIIKHGLPWHHVREVDTDIFRQSSAGTSVAAHQEPQPPEGFMFPGEERSLPSYESLKHPPAYQETIQEGSSKEQQQAKSTKKKVNGRRNK